MTYATHMIHAAKVRGPGGTTDADICITGVPDPELSLKIGRLLRAGGYRIDINRQFTAPD